MLLDNVFPMLGGVGTAAALMGIITLLSTPVLGHLVCPLSQLKRIPPRGR